MPAGEREYLPPSSSCAALPPAPACPPPPCIPAHRRRPSWLPSRPTLQVGSQPWEGPESAGNFTLCAGITGIVRGQRKSFACATAADGSAPVGEFVAIWRPSAGAKQLTLCEVDVELGPQQGAGGSEQPAARRRRSLSGAAPGGRRRLRAVAAAAWTKLRRLGRGGSKAQ